MTPGIGVIVCLRLFRFTLFIFCGEDYFREGEEWKSEKADVFLPKAQGVTIIIQ